MSETGTEKNGPTAAPSEQKRLEATALVASRVSREESHQVVRRAQLRTYIREAVLLLLGVLVAILAYRNFTEGQRTKTAIIRSEQQNCQLDHDVALSPIIPQTSVTGLHILADFRNNYYALHCEKTKLGPLPPASKRMAPLLMPGAK